METQNSTELDRTRQNPVSGVGDSVIPSRKRPPSLHQIRYTMQKASTIRLLETVENGGNGSLGEYNRHLVSLGRLGEEEVRVSTRACLLHANGY